MKLLKMPGFAPESAAAEEDALQGGGVVAIATTNWWCALADVKGAVHCYVLEGGLLFEKFRHTAPIVSLKASSDVCRLAFIDCNGEAFVYCLESSTCLA